VRVLRLRGVSQRISHVAVFVAALLNDLFGVQVRGGCMCAGPIVQAEMGISSAAADVLENMMLQVSAFSCSLFVIV
jgi:selenocysteine lyase/cysteine desulfurase